MTIEQQKNFKKSFVTSSDGSSGSPGKADIKRKMHAIYIKDANEPDSVYEMLGYKQEEMTVASNYETEDMSDVTGMTYTDVKSKAEKIELSGYHVNPNKTKFLSEAIKMKALDMEEQMQNYTVLTVYGFMRADGSIASIPEDSCFAFEQTECTVVLDNEGGSGYVTEDVSITLSGKKVFGTVPEITASPTFTAYNPTT